MPFPASWSRSVHTAFAFLLQNNPLDASHGHIICSKNVKVNQLHYIVHFTNDMMLV